MAPKNEYTELEKCEESWKQSKADAPTKDVQIDGGWGWMIVFASFICNMSIDGIAYSAGLVLAPVKEEFDAMESEVMTISSIQQCIYFILGPMISILINKHGFSLVSMAGTVLVALGLGTSFYANGVTYLCITYGFITGLGFSMIYLPSILIVGFYFDRWRALATGIAVCGSSVGIFVVTPFTQFMINKFGWRLAIISQIFFAVISFIVSLIFYREPPKITEEVTDNNNANNMKTAEYNEQQIKTTISCKVEQNGSCTTNEQCKIPHKIYADDLSVPFLSNGDNKNNSVAMINLDNGRKKSLFDDVFAPRRSIVFTQRDHRKSLSMVIGKSCMQSYLELFRSPVFILLAFNGLLYMSALLTPYNYTVKRAQLVGGVENTAWYLPAIGISNTIGRVVCGYISSIEKISALWVHNVLIILSGLVLIFSGISHEFFYQLGYCIALGIGFAAFPALRSVLAAQFLGLEGLTNSFGLLLFFDSIGALIGAPIAGGLIDLTGDFNAPFYLAGGILILSALILFPLNIVSKWEQNKISKKHSSSLQFR